MSGRRRRRENEVEVGSGEEGAARASSVFSPRLFHLLPSSCPWTRTWPPGPWPPWTAAAWAPGRGRGEGGKGVRDETSERARGKPIMSVERVRSCGHPDHGPGLATAQGEGLAGQLDGPRCATRLGGEPAGVCGAGVGRRRRSPDDRPAKRDGARPCRVASAFGPGSAQDMLAQMDIASAIARMGRGGRVKPPLRGREASAAAGRRAAGRRQPARALLPPSAPAEGPTFSRPTVGRRKVQPSLTMLGDCFSRGERGGRAGEMKEWRRERKNLLSPTPKFTFVPGAVRH